MKFFYILQIEDVILDIETFDKYILEKQTPIQENSFNVNYDPSKVVDIKNLGIIKKRDRKEMEKAPIITEVMKENKDINAEEKNDFNGEKVIKYDGHQEILNPKNESSI